MAAKKTYKELELELLELFSRIVIKTYEVKRHRKSSPEVASEKLHTSLGNLVSAYEKLYRDLHSYPERMNGLVHLFPMNISLPAASDDEFWRA